jgi:hypothetical protein
MFNDSQISTGGPTGGATSATHAPATDDTQTRQAEPTLRKGYKLIERGRLAETNAIRLASKTEMVTEIEKLIDSGKLVCAHNPEDNSFYFEVAPPQAWAHQ